MVDQKDLYLEKDAVFAEAQALGGQAGEPLSISAVTLHKRLDERGLLLTIDKTRGTLHIRRKLDGATRNVLHLSADVFSAAVSTGTKPDISDIDSVSDVPKEDSGVIFPCSAIWRNQNNDQPVTVIGERGEQDGRRYMEIEGYATGIPEDELTYGD